MSPHAPRGFEAILVGYEVVACLVAGAVDREQAVLHRDGAIRFASVVVQQTNGAPGFAIRMFARTGSMTMGGPPRARIRSSFKTLMSRFRASDRHNEPFLGRGQVAVALPGGDVDGGVTALRFNGHVPERAALAVGKPDDRLGAG